MSREGTTGVYKSQHVAQDSAHCTAVSRVHPTLVAAARSAVMARTPDRPVSLLSSLLQPIPRPIFDRVLPKSLALGICRGVLFTWPTQAPVSGHTAHFSLSFSGLPHLKKHGSRAGVNTPPAHTTVTASGKQRSQETLHYKLTKKYRASGQGG